MDRKYPAIEIGTHEIFRDTVLKLTDPSGVLQTIPVADGDIVALGDACRAYAQARGLAIGNGAASPDAEAQASSDPVIAAFRGSTIAAIAVANASWHAEHDA